MTCRQAQSLLEDLADGELSPALSSELQSHLQGCFGCRTEYEHTVRLKELLTQRAAPNPGPRYFAEVTDLILARTAQADDEGPEVVLAVTGTRGAFLRSVLAAAASIAVFLTSVWFGSFQPMAVAEREEPDAARPAVSLMAMVQSDDNVIMNAGEKQRLSSALLLMGPPGMLGRGGEIAGSLGLE